MPIRELPAEDYERLVRLWKESGMDSKLKGRDSQESIRKQISSGSVFILGDESKGELRGAVIVSHDGRKGWMNRLAVLPEHREKGIATTLIKEAERRLKKIGIGIFAAGVEEENASSRKLFEQLGYVPRRDIIYYVKRLDDEI